MPFHTSFWTPTFRLAAIFASAFTFATLLLFAFIYWQTAVVETARVDGLLVRDAELLSRASPHDILRAVDMRVAGDFHRITYAALFDSNGQRVAGNLDQLPAAVPPDGHAHQTEMVAHGDDNATYGESVRVVIRRLADGGVLVIGRSVDSLEDLRGVVIRALELGVIPAVAMALLVGAFASRRAQRQVKAVHLTAERIMRGNLKERLPTRGNGDDFDRLAGSVNHMLDEIERLLDEVKSTSDNIAHDLRTPLTRVRSRLERARDTAASHGELQEMVDRAILGLDQTLRIITALLRIGQIEGSRRRAGFSSVNLQSIVREVGDLYEPFAEEKQIRLTIDAKDVPPVQGDPDLLCEVLTNLVDNAIKFTPAGGRVSLGLELESGHPLIRVIDNGPGIPAEERESVLRRFYRSDKSRHVAGCGLGLSLVDAIVRLHGFRLAIGDARPGCIIEVLCAE